MEDPQEKTAEETPSGPKIEDIQGALEQEAVLPFPWVTLLIVMSSVIFAVCLFAYQQRKRPEHDFQYDSIGSDHYKVSLPPEVEMYEEFKERFDMNQENKVPLQKALFDRAMASVPLILYMQNEAPNANSLYKRSMIGESTWRSFKDSEEMVRQEMEDVRYEADLLRLGWGDMIWHQAVQVHHNKARQQEQEAEAQAAAEEEKRKEANRAKREKSKAKAKALKPEVIEPTAEEKAEQARLQLERLLAQEEESKAAAASTAKKGGGGSSKKSKRRSI